MAFVQPAVAAASVKAVAELLSCCGIGFYAAKQGILSPPNVSALSKIVYGLFLPALLVVNVAETVVSQPVASLLPIPIFATVQIGLGLLLSRLTMWALRVDPDTDAGRECKV
ncbi:unnamed protein product, partial [Choristocarpus tenellus]